MSSTLVATARTDLRRHLRAPGLWWTLLAAPIAAPYLVPPPGASYATLTVNGASLVLTPSVLGLTLALVSVTVLTPAAFVFLRGGTTRTRPWQVADTLPHSRVAAALGSWSADTIVLCSILGALTVAGWILGLLRLPEYGLFQMLRTTVALWVPTVPALALVAAIRAALDARPWTRRWAGDVLFVVTWLALMMTSMVSSQAGGTGARFAPTLDPFGLVAPLVAASTSSLTAISIGATAPTGEALAVDAWRGVVHPKLVASRVVWLLLALALAALAGAIRRPRGGSPAGRLVASVPVSADEAGTVSGPPWSDRGISPLVPAERPFVERVTAEARLLLRGQLLCAGLAAGSLSGLFLPYPSLAGPVVWLLMIAPLTGAAGRWQSASTRTLLDTTGSRILDRSLALVTAATTILALASLPAALHSLVSGSIGVLMEIAAVSAAVPLVAVVAGSVTRGAVAGRVLLLIAWYVYFSVSAG